MKLNKRNIHFTNVNVVGVSIYLCCLVIYSTVQQPDNLLHMVIAIMLSARYHAYNGALQSAHRLGTLNRTVWALVLY